MNSNSVFGFDKGGYLPDSEIEKLYQEKIKSLTNDEKEIGEKLFKASWYDPRRSDIYFDTEDTANKAQEIANKLHSMSKGEFMSSNYSYGWFDELSGASLFKIVNKSVLKPKPQDQ